MGFIYYAEHAPNPWVRGVAIVVAATFAYFYGDSPGVPPQHEWIGHYGMCNGDADEFDHWY